MKVIVSKSIYFEAAHWLPDYQGDCGNMHGHSYKLEVGVSGQIDPNTGMVCDFKALKSALNVNISKLDHKVLNTFFDVPTAENMAWEIFLVLKQSLGANLTLEWVRLWETRDSYAEVRR